MPLTPRHARPHSVRQADARAARLPRLLPPAGPVDVIDLVTTTDSGAVAAIVNHLEEHPYRFAQSYLNLVAFVRQLHTRVENLEFAAGSGAGDVGHAVDREIL